MTEMNTTPCFSSDAQETFAPGARVFEVGSEEFDYALYRYTRGEGTFRGWIGGDEHSPRAAVVDWDDGRESTIDFDMIRNLYR